MNDDAGRSPRRGGETPRIVLLTHGFETGGGVPAVARWLRSNLVADGRYSVDVCDLATSRRDPASRRVAAARSWRAAALIPSDVMAAGATLFSGVGACLFSGTGAALVPRLA